MADEAHHDDRPTARYRMILTGTPMTQGYVDLYAQMRFLSPKILGYNSFYSFAANHLEYSDRFPGKIVRAHNTQYLAAKMQPYVYQITKDEADLHLPSKVYETYHVPMSGDQLAAYEAAKDELLSIDEDEWGQLDQWWESIRIFRLFTTPRASPLRWRCKDGTVVELPHYRTEVLLSVVKQIPPPEKVVIWAQYLYALRQIAEALAGEYGADEVVQPHGSMSPAKRNEALAVWRNERFPGRDSGCRRPWPGYDSRSLHGLSTPTDSNTASVCRPRTASTGSGRHESRCTSTSIPKPGSKIASSVPWPQRATCSPIFAKRLSASRGMARESALGSLSNHCEGSAWQAKRTSMSTCSTPPESASGRLRPLRGDLRLLQRRKRQHRPQPRPGGGAAPGSHHRRAIHRSRSAVPLHDRDGRGGDARGSAYPPVVDLPPAEPTQCGERVPAALGLLGPEGGEILGPADAEA